MLSIRPIIDSAGGPLSKVETWIKSQLRGIEVDYSNTISNTDELIKELKKIEVKKEYKMISLDVKSMFTTIPHKLVNDTLVDILKEENKDNSEFLRHTINMVLEKNFFKHEGEIYQQIVGLPMGNKISPTLANIVMTKFYSYMMAKKGIKFYKRYVDDTVIIYNEKEIELKKIEKYANDWHQDIKFTTETEVDNSLNILDITITNVNNKLEFKTFKKKVNTDRMINAKSALPDVIKRNTVMNYFFKIIKRTTDKTVMENDIINVKKIAKLNGYKEGWIKKTLTLAFKKSKNKIKKSVETSAEDTEKKSYFGITYTKGLFEQLNKIGKKFKINLAPRAVNKIKNKLTNKVMNAQNSEFDQGVIYKVKCSCGKCYIGESGRRVSDRMNEHKKDVEYGKKTSAIFEHILENKSCNFKWDEVKVLKKSKEVYVRKFIENEMIEKFKDSTINRNVGLAPNVLWKKLLKFKLN